MTYPPERTSSQAGIDRAGGAPEGPFGGGLPATARRARRPAGCRPGRRCRAACRRRGGRPRPPPGRGRAGRVAWRAAAVGAGAARLAAAVTSARAALGAGAAGLLRPVAHAAAARAGDDPAAAPLAPVLRRAVRRLRVGRQVVPGAG